jgi:hypothetical protein
VLATVATEWDSSLAGGPWGRGHNARSANGLYTVTLSNQGILLKGPRGSVTINGYGAQMNTIGGAATP